MTIPYTARGRARLGWVEPPFAKLSATSEQLVISTWFFGECRFDPDRVSAIEKHIQWK
jgi:hypothetical protein